MRKVCLLICLFYLFLVNPAHAGLWDDIKEKSGDLKEKVMTEENKEKAQEYLDENKDDIKDWAEDAGESTKDFFKKL